MEVCFFENRDCAYYPCHAMEEINCLFCFCPLYARTDCGGQYTLLRREGRPPVKDCSGCTFPHRRENYREVIRRLEEESFQATEKDMTRE